MTPTWAKLYHMNMKYKIEESFHHLKYFTALVDLQCASPLDIEQYGKHDGSLLVPFLERYQLSNSRTKISFNSNECKGLAIGSPC